MKFCIVKRDMTPDYPVFLSGYGGRNRKSDGVGDPIFFKAVLLQADKSLLLLTFDVTGGDRSFVTGIKKTLKMKFGLQEDEILMNFSHSHCSINLTGEDPELRRGNYSMAQDRYPDFPEEVDYTEDVRYYHRLQEQIVDAVGFAFAHLQEGTLRLSRGASDIAVSRRLPSESGIQFRPNPAEPIDRDLFVMKLVDTQGSVKGILFNVACHPTSMAGYMLSADFVGHACTCIEEEYPGSIAVFLQGCAADLKPAKGVNGSSFKACNEEEMREIGAELAVQVSGVIKNGEFTDVEGPFRSKLADIRLYTEPHDVAEIESMLQDESKTEYRKKAIRRLLRAIENGYDRKTLNEYISIWELGGNTRMIAMEGEIFSEFSLTVKQIFNNDRTVVLGYSNGVSTYIPTRRVLREGGYEAEVYIFFLRGPFVPETEETMLGAIAKMAFTDGGI